MFEIPQHRHTICCSAVKCGKILLKYTGKIIEVRRAFLYKFFLLLGKLLAINVNKIVKVTEKKEKNKERGLCKKEKNIAHTGINSCNIVYASHTIKDKQFTLWGNFVKCFFFSFWKGVYTKRKKIPYPGRHPVKCFWSPFKKASTLKRNILLTLHGRQFCKKCFLSPFQNESTTKGKILLILGGNSVKNVFCSPFEKESTTKGNILLTLGGNSIKLVLVSLLKRSPF